MKTAKDKLSDFAKEENLKAKKNSYDIKESISNIDSILKLQQQIGNNALLKLLESRISDEKNSSLKSGGSGQPLDNKTKSEMEHLFRHDFGDVRIHTDPQTAQSAQKIGARAYTTQNHIVFNNGQYKPSEPWGQGLIAHELTHVVQNEKSNLKELNSNRMYSDTSSEAEAGKITERVNMGMNAGPITQAGATIAMTPASKSIESLSNKKVSHKHNILFTPPSAYDSYKDYMLGIDEQNQIIETLHKDTDISSTIIDLYTTGNLSNIFIKVSEPSLRQELIRILGTGLNSKAHALVEPYIADLGIRWELQYNLERQGLNIKSSPINKNSFSSLISSSDSEPFTGAGATGINPTSLDISYLDMARLYAGNKTTTAEYSNPLGNLSKYLAGLTPKERAQQAELLLKQQISTVYPQSYKSSDKPSRAQVIKTASDKYNLEPQLVSAIILAEQRDQSKKEDAKDYLSAKMAGYNSSIGLGQVVVSTSTKKDLFSDLLSSKTRGALSHEQKATLLASDEFNIFAVAKYIRIVADIGAKKAAKDLPNTFKVFPGINLKAYSGHSSTWPQDNIAALGMYYTSKAWTDDIRSVYWGKFVLEAYKDVVSSKVF